MLRLTGILLTVLFAIGAAIVTWPSFFRVERMFPIAQIVAFRPLIVLAFATMLLLALLLALARPMRAFALSIATVCLLAAGAGAVMVAERGVGAEALPAKGETSLRVMTWNTAGGEATAPEKIAQTAVTMEADVVALPETTIETGSAVAEAMREMGHPMWAHHTKHGLWDASSTTLLISPDLGDYAVIESSRDGSSNTSVVPSAVAMPVDGSGPIIVAAHAVAPRQNAMQAWRDDLQWLADQCAADDVIMAGDFNATIDHMLRMGVDGGHLGRCRDAAADSGTGAAGTWPTDVPSLIGSPIDHVMTTDAWTVSGSVVLTSMDGVGSDHRPLVVQLEPAG
ncbi:endonuclease/exonuclease/phosphatase family protein [Microbacterium sp. zg.Y1090]|uniref:endonuclease/exonuclease/phosphatase family protein n=1 Tax=Microbacterium TaxID=33882 RepID=UPI00214CDF80|nr:MULTISPECIES: endonuclease/exonuclease/phosphatase family protein [unclassified Microbacterium]MCR2812067.1 endonuclease/exonuclease/phosphatase family protein [Microbacterium sp. zg.Y1084]MCR2818494.1 endonuclease/exonuclease/phosphatase family protein [Microbacterium sp. zg.Y1090]MDL5486307.1 endonuclease/exonuclease/phosphatase family protein [Microbacterium sp. zg-Y1211]WIM29503.1 endonuclease/exonuclease/phosphatase family protein [Microbacterium sp. zg-Y1090]